MKSTRWTIKADELTQHGTGNSFEQLLPDVAGSGFSRTVPLDRDLICIETAYAPSRDLAILSTMDQPGPRLVLTLGLQGESRFVGDRGTEVVFVQGYTTITAFNASAGERRYEAHKPVRQLRLSLGAQWLENYFGEARLKPWFTGGEIRTLSFHPVSVPTMMAARSLLAQKEPAGLGRMRMQGEALTVLATELMPLLANDDARIGKLTTRDKAIALRARDILFAEFRSPPSVPELARRAGTNAFKLKGLFRQVFNNTPYGLLLEYRMTEAYTLLRSTHGPIKVVADLVGYRHAGNFSAAFTRYFGVSPKSVAGDKTSTTS